MSNWTEDRRGGREWRVDGCEESGKCVPVGVRLEREDLGALEWLWQWRRGPAMEAEEEEVPRMRKTRILGQRLTSEVLNFSVHFILYFFFASNFFFLSSFFMGINYYYYFEKWIGFERQRFICLFGGTTKSNTLPFRCFLL